MNDSNEMLIRINGTATEFIKEIDKIKKKTEDLQQILETTAKVSAVAFAAFAASIALSTKEFAEYEKALVGVGKTTDINGKQLDAFGKKFQELAQKIPISTNELLGIAQAAGQLGVKGEADLLKFTETVAKLGVATDLSGEDAAVALTRILTVTGEGVANIDKFGSVIVALGNNFAATESEIVRVATEVSRATAVFGVSSSEAAALAAALKSMGIQAELGGSAVGRTFRAIDASIRSGGSALENLSKVTGIAAGDLKKAFAEDSTQVFQKFVEGIGRISAAGGDTTAVLGAFKLKGDEILKVLPVLAKNSELLGSALGMAAKEMANSTALNNEAAKAFETLAADGQRLKNVVTTLAVNIGAELAPELKKLLQGTTDIVGSIASMDKGLVAIIATFLKWGAILAGSLTAVSSAAIGYLTFTRIIGALKLAFDASRIAIVGFTSAATLGLSVIVAFLPEIISGVGDMFKAFKDKKQAEESLESLASKLKAIKERRDEINSIPVKDGFVRNTEALDAEIAKYEELYNAKLKNSQGFGDGSLLVRPEADAGGFDPTFGLQAQTIPLAPEGASSDVEKTKADEDAKFELISKAQEKRLIKAKEINAALIDEASGMSEKEIELQKEFYAIAEAERVNQFEKNEELKAIEDQNIALRYEVAGVKLQEHLALEEQKKQEYREITAANDNLSLEQKVAAESKYEAASSKEKAKLLKSEQIFNQQRIQNEQQLTSSKVALAQASGEAIIALTGRNALAGLALSKGIAITQAFIDKSRADIGSLAQSRMLPPGVSEGYLAQALAVNNTQFGFSLATIAAQTITGAAGLNEGGMLPYGNHKRGVDSIQAPWLTPGELVVPEKNFDEVVSATAEKRGMGLPDGSEGERTNVYIQGDFYGSEAHIDYIVDKINDGIKTRNVRLL